MNKKTRGLKALAAATALAAGLWTHSALADLQADVTRALGAGSEAAQMAALRTVSEANAANPETFLQLTTLVAAHATEDNAASLAGALAAACTVTRDDTMVTRLIVRTFVADHPKVGGQIFNAVVRGGCPVEIAAAELQSTLATSAGQLLSRVSVLPPNTPGTGVNLLQNPGNIKELGLTTRLGNIGGGVLDRTTETPQSQSTPTDPGPALRVN
jgi:hypothetical protein